MKMNGPFSQSDTMIVGADEVERARLLTVGRLPESPLPMPTQRLERVVPVRTLLRLFIAGRQHSARV